MAKRQSSINPRTDPDLKLASAWLRKLTSPTNATFRLVTARVNPSLVFALTGVRKR